MNRLTSYLRIASWEKHILNPSCIYGPCYVCKYPINIVDYRAGFVIHPNNGGKLNKENIRPICHRCHDSIGSGSVQTYKLKYYPEEE